MAERKLGHQLRRYDNLSSSFERRTRAGYSTTVIDEAGKLV